MSTVTLALSPVHGEMTLPEPYPASQESFQIQILLPSTILHQDPALIMRLTLHILLKAKLGLLQP